MPAAVDNAAALDAALADPDADGAVLDVRLPPTFTDEGLRAAIAARARGPGFPVLVLSQYVEQLYARELLASGDGAVGYLLKDRVSDVAAVRRRRTPGRRGRHGPGPRGGRRRHGPPARRAAGPADAARDARCSALMAEGRSNAAIAARLFITEKAVGKHINSIFGKLDLPARPTTTTAGSRRCWRTSGCDDRVRSLGQRSQVPEDRSVVAREVDA